MRHAIRAPNRSLSTNQQQRIRAGVRLVADGRIERGALRFDEIVEGVRVQTDSGAVDEHAVGGNSLAAIHSPGVRARSFDDPGHAGCSTSIDRSIPLTTVVLNNSRVSEFP